MIAKPSDHAFEQFHRFHFKALNTKVDLLIWAESHEIKAIERTAIEWFRDAEARFSSKLSYSEINMLNTLAGERCKISDKMLEVLSLAETYRRITQNAYNPLMWLTTGSEAYISLDSDTKSVRLPNDTQLDLESIVQDWILQKLVDLLQNRMKLKQGILQVGGSYKVWGRPRESFDPWLIEIHKPGGAEMDVVASLAMSEGAAVTYVREDESDSYEGDKRVRQITVAGADVVECGIWAQAISNLGIDAGIPLLARQAPHCEAVIITTENKLHYYGNKALVGTKWSEMEIDHYH